eukprot:322000_1
MISTQLLTLSLLAYITSSATKYFVGTYVVPLQDPVILAYPIDQCINYEAGIGAIYFGKYTCNSQADQVTFTKYGEDTACLPASALSEGNDAPKTYTMGVLAAGDLKSFSCTGDDNYAEVNSCTATLPSAEPAIGADGGIVCCPDQLAASGDAVSGCLSQLQATGVCAKLDDTTFTMSTCTNETVITNAYGDNTCSGQAVSTISTQFTDYCSYYSKVDIVNYAVYRRLLKCFEAGVNIAPEDDYCPFETDTPTKMPSVSPTVATDPPTQAGDDDSQGGDDSSSGNTYEIIYGLILSMVVGFIYMR